MHIILLNKYLEYLLSAWSWKSEAFEILFKERKKASKTKPSNVPHQWMNLKTCSVSEIILEDTVRQRKWKQSHSSMSENCQQASFSSPKQDTELDDKRVLLFSFWVNRWMICDKTLSSNTSNCTQIHTFFYLGTFLYINTKYEFYNIYFSQSWSFMHLKKDLKLLLSLFIWIFCKVLSFFCNITSTILSQWLLLISSCDDDW